MKTLGFALGRFLGWLSTWFYTANVFLSATAGYLIARNTTPEQRVAYLNKLLKQVGLEAVVRDPQEYREQLLDEIARKVSPDAPRH